MTNQANGGNQKKKRANGEGTIRQRADGRWEAMVSLPGGKRKSLYGRTYEEARRKRTAAQKARDDGLPVPTDRQTVKQFLTSWLEGIKPTLRGRTWDRYEQYVRVHAGPVIGNMGLTRLGPQHLQQLYKHRLDAGCSPTTVAHLHAVLHRALEQATRWGLVPRNVADYVDPPQMARQEMKTLDQDQARTLLAAAKDDPLEALYVLALSTGMREGELLGLRWQDIELDKRILHVRGALQQRRKPREGEGGLMLTETKTKKSRRPAVLIPRAIDALRRHQERQQQQRQRMGVLWEEHDLVFTNGVGKPIETPHLLQRSFYPLLDRAELPRIRFHDLRHSVATFLLGENTHAKITSALLGHSQVGITLDLYSHVSLTMQQQAAEVLARILEE